MRPSFIVVVFVQLVVIGIEIGSVSGSITSYKLTLSNTNGRESDELEGQRGGQGESRGVVTPVNCGGAGTVSQTRVSDCNALPCPLRNTTRIEIDFRPSKNSTNAMSRFTYTPKGGLPLNHTQILGPMYMTQNMTYTMTNFSDSVTRQEVEIKIEIVNDLNANEFCLVGTFNAGLVGTTTRRPNHATAVSGSVMGVTAVGLLLSVLTPKPFFLNPHS